mgnify:CR=1 FL=1
MKIEHDSEADAIYYRLSPKAYRFGEDLDHQRRVDYVEDGTPIGVEFLYVSQGIDLRSVPSADKIGRALSSLKIKILAS